MKISDLVLRILFMSSFTQAAISQDIFWQKLGFTGGTVYSVLASSNGNIYVGESDSGLYRSTDIGVSWNRINAGFPTNAIQSLVMNSAGDIFAAGHGIYRSNGNIGSWSQLLARPDLYAFSLAINSSGYIFAGGDTCRVYRSTDNGTHWTIASLLLQPYWGIVRSLAINASGYIFAGFDSGYVYRSTDNGDTWSRTNTNAGSYRAISALATNSSGHVFAGAYNGVYRSIDTGSTWSRIGLPTMTIKSLFVNSIGYVFAGTNSGIFRWIEKEGLWTQVGFANTSVNAVYIDSTGTIFAGVDKSVWVAKGELIPAPSLSSPLDRAIKQGTSPTLTWNPASNAVSYQIQVSTDSTFSALVLNDSSLTATSRGIGPLANKTKYYWHVRGANLGGLGVYSNPWSFTTVLSTPTNLISVAGNKKISLSWSPIDSQSIRYYKIFRGTSSPASSVIDSVSVPATFYVDSSLGNVQYFYRITAVDSTGEESPFSNEVNAIPLVSPILQNPTNTLYGVSVSPTLSWSPVLGITRYHLQISTDSLFSSIVAQDTNIAQTSKQVGLLRSGTTYWWRVRSSNSLNTSSFSQAWNFTTLIAPATNMAVTAGNHNIHLTWSGSDSPNLKLYRIYRDTSSSPTRPFDSVSAISGSYVDSILVNKTRYYYRIKTVNNLYLESDYSAEVSAVPSNQSPKAAALSGNNFPSVGRVLSTSLTYSSSGSTDPDGRIDSTLWYINGNFLSSNPFITYPFGPGTTAVMLVVKDNDGATDTSRAIVNRTAFNTPLNGPIYAGLSLLGDSLLYAVATGDAVYKLAYDGRKVYNLQVGGSVRSSSSISYDTTVYISSSDKNLYAFNKNGVPVWAPVPLGGELSATPVIDSLLNRLYIGVSNSNFFAVNRTTGTVEWSLFADAPIKQSAVLTSDRKLIFTSTRGTIYGIDLSAQSKPTAPTWTLLLGDTITSSPAIDVDGNFYAGTYSGKVIKVSLQKGSDAKIVWQAQTGGTVYAAPVIDASGTVFVGSGDKKLYVLDGNTGTVRWSYPTSGAIRSAAALSSRAIVYVANDAGEIFALDSAQSVQWYYRDSSAISAPLLFQKGTLYVGTEGGKVVALYDGVDGSSLEKGVGGGSTPIWGTFQGNNQRTGVQSAARGVVATIYPGDANNDGIVDVRDLLPIGRFYANTGTPRQNGSATWSKQVLTSPWNPFDACYADCDGNGTVDAQDVTVVIQNWHATPSGSIPENIDRRAVAEQLLKEIDGQPQSEAVKAIRGSIVKYMQERLGVVFTFALEQNYPDPFNPTTTIQFVLPVFAQSSTLTIYNVIGELVWERNLGVLDVGTHFVQWDGTSSRGSKVASGAYVYRLVSGSYTAQKRMLLLK